MTPPAALIQGQNLASFKAKREIRNTEIMFKVLRDG